ncbi:ParB/RepB/Spo0J family partition protein [Parafrankia discariae]|uniref:ParB/RepB/Spo0J family partition protein n=1 Tax=Parafrankia discariae TaxID=365528 RepID=UPI000369CC9E|nr:ParB/RepB/Spo0J family partition protein [Parafrankia discariae]
MSAAVGLPVAGAPAAIPTCAGPPAGEGMAPGPAELARRLATSPRLRHRRYEMLPLRGAGAVFTEVQGRTPGDATTPASLADLISSISTVGVLQPILVEERSDPAGPPTRLLVTGERRLRAARWGAVHQPDNPHFAEIPAVVCPGPLSEEERRVWQLVENLAREDLRPGELAAALLFERCAVLIPRLLAAGRPVPREVLTLDDPVQRWRHLERIRGGDASVGAPWGEVLQRLGLQLSERRARQLHAALSSLPPEISEEMDEAGVALATRLRFAALNRGRARAADEIWAAVRAAGRPDLLPGALIQRQTAPDLDAETALERAAQVRAAGNTARAAALTRTPLPAGGASTVPVVVDPEPAAGPLPGAVAERQPSPVSAQAGPSTEPPPAELIPADQTAAVRRTLTELCAQLRTGRTVPRYDAGSLRLLAGELLRLLGADPDASTPREAES